MFVSWSCAPKSNLDDREFFTSEEHAVDVAFDWSVEMHGDPIIVFRGDVQWMEVVAWFDKLKTVQFVTLFQISLFHPNACYLD